MLNFVNIDDVAEEQPVLSAALGGRPTWTRWYEIFRVVGYPPYLRRTVSIASIVGTVLFIINHLDEVISGEVTARIYVKGALTYLVPFVVSNLGVLVASRRRPGSADRTNGKEVL